MKKIICGLLMLSMVFSLVACSSEPTSDMIDNDYFEESGEVSEEIDVSNVNTDNSSIFGMDKEDLSAEQLETYNTLINTLWRSSFKYEEGMEDTVDDFGTTLDFHEDGTVIMVEDGVTKNGTWTAEWVTITVDDMESERANIEMSFDDDIIYYMSLKPNDDENIHVYSNETHSEIWFNNSEDVEIQQVSRVYDDFTLAETVWELSSITDENGYVEYDVNPLIFEFTSGIEGKLVQPTKEDNVGFAFDATSITMLASEFYHADHIDTEFEMTSEFFEKYNDENNNTANCEIYDKQLTITTDTLIFKFRYGGTTVNTPLTGDISLDLASIYDFDLPEDYDDNTSDSVDIENYSLLLKVDGTAEFSNGSEIITGSWDYVNHLWRGESNFTINLTLDSNLLDFESNSNFFDSLSQQVENDTYKHKEFEVTQDGADSYTLEIYSSGSATIKSKYNSFTFDYNR